MASHARFAAVVFPAYIVLGRLLGAAPAWVTWVVIGAFSIMLMTLDGDCMRRGICFFEVGRRRPPRPPLRKGGRRCGVVGRPAPVRGA